MPPAQDKRDSIKIALAELSIRAPKAARVESLELRPGDLLAANATAARLAEDDQLYVRIFVPETEIGNAKQLLVTPIHPLGLMLGKLAPYLVLGVFEASLVLFAMRFGFDVPIRGNLLFLAVMVIVYLFSLLAMGLLVSTRAKSQSEAMQSAQMLFLPSIFLSGYIFPAAGLPLPLYLIGRCLPATHMIEIMRGIVLRDAGPRELWPNVLALIVMGIFLVGLSARRFQKVAL